MVLVSRDLKITATWEFDADVLVLHHPTTISARYQAMGKINLNISFNFCYHFCW